MIVKGQRVEEADDARWPAFTGLDGKQGQHGRRHVVVVEVPSLPSTRLDDRKLVRIRVLEVLTSVHSRHTNSDVQNLFFFKFLFGFCSVLKTKSK